MKHSPSCYNTKKVFYIILLMTTPEFSRTDAFTKVFFGQRAGKTPSLDNIPPPPSVPTPPPPSPFNSRKIVTISAIAFTVLALLLGGFGYWHLSAPSRLQAAITEAQKDIRSYESEFLIQQASGTVLMTGVMVMDLEKGLVGGETTIPDIGTMKTVLSADHYYAKVSIANPTIQTMVQLPSDWIDYDLSDPSSPAGRFFQERIFWANTRQITQGDCSLPKEEQLEALPTLYLQCTFTDPKSATTGTAEVWFNSNTLLPLQLKATVSGMTITERISKVNYAPEIFIPENALTLDAWKEKQFFAGLPKENISAIVIYRGKGVSLEEESAAVRAIHAYYGVTPVTFPEDVGAISDRQPLYNAERKQYDADTVWSLIGNQKQGTSTRFLYLLPVDMYSPISPERPYVFSRALPGVNTILLSLAPLRTTPPEVGSTTPALVNERIGKAVVRAVGVSTGIAYSEDAERKECIMYQATTTQELDRVGTSTCPLTERAVTQVFKFTPSTQTSSTTPVSE